MRSNHGYGFAPLPGTERAPRGLFVKRWGTLLHRPPKGWCARFREARFFEGALEALFRAQRAGWRIYLVGNETGVARGRWSDASYERFEEELHAHLFGLGIPVTRSYVCTDDPVDGKGAHRRDSVYFLPNTGAFYHAGHEDGIRLERSWVVGDGTLELVAGWRSGCRTAGVRTGLALGDAEYHVDPDLICDDLRDVLVTLLRAEESACA